MTTLKWCVGVGLLVLATSGTLLAQRPWQKAVTPTVGNPPGLHLASNGVYAINDSMAISIDHGQSWTTLQGLPRNIRGVADFLGSVTICVAQAQAGDSAEVWFSQGGSAWTLSERLSVGTGSVIDLTAIGQTFYLATDNGSILARSRSIEMLTIPLAEGDSVRDVVMTNTVMAAHTIKALYVSADAGQTWTLSAPSAEHPVSSIAAANDDLYVACRPEVYRYNVQTSGWDSRTSVAPLPGWVQAFAVDPLYIAAVVQMPDGDLQMFRQEVGTTAWDSVGYTLQIPGYVSNRDRMIIDGGWALLYIQSALAPDNDGLYRYDLYDNITGVSEEHSSDVRIEVHQHCLTIEHAWSGPVSVDIYTVQGQRIHQYTNPCAGCPIPLPPGIHGPVATVVRGLDRTITRLVFVP